MKKQNQDKLSDILPDGHYPVASGTDAYFSFLKKCIEEDPLYDEGELKQAGATFSKHSRAIQNEILNFKIQASQYPLMMAIFLWAQWISDDRVFGEKYLSMMQELVETNILIHKGLRDGNPVSLSEFALWDAETIVEYIRCVEKWPIEKREDYVKFYCEFSHWLSKHTFGFIPIAVDQNREVTQQRKLPFEIYIKFLMNLEQREQIMVKLFYLGGSVALEDVLSLKLQDINFDDRTITLGGTPIKYSRHVLNDINAYVGSRTRGFVFIGKKNERINHTVPYRALKSVAIKLGLESAFTFKDFVKNQ